MLYSKSVKKVFFFVIFILILAAIYLIKFSNINDVSKTNITPTPTDFQFPTDAPIPTDIPLSVTSIPQNTVDKTTNLDRSELSIEVQNGSNKSLAATKLSEILRSLGYHILSITNAENADYLDLTIEIKQEELDFVSLLKKDLGDSYLVASVSALPVDSKFDAIIIVGQ